MAKRKGLSFDEKREKLLKIFHDKKEVFNLKELEKLGAKAGIVLQTVKEVLDSLLADDLVTQDKIGSANFFWALPSQAGQTISNKIKEQNEAIAKLNEEKEVILAQIDLAYEQRQETEDRKNKLDLLNQLQEELKELESQEEQYARNDPKRLIKLQKEAQELKQKANLWTGIIYFKQQHLWIDNIFTTMQWIMNKQAGMSEEQVQQYFQIPENLDNL